MMQQKRILSRLTLKIFAVNGIALVFLAFGLIYLGQYETDLIKTELSALERQATIYAGAIAESSRVQGPMLMNNQRGATILKYDRLGRFPARKMIRRLSETTSSRIRLYDFDGSIIADSDWLDSAMGIKEMGPSSRRSQFLRQPVIASLDFILDLLPSSLKLKNYPVENQTVISGLIYPEVSHSLTSGDKSASVWNSINAVSGQKEMLLSAAVPVKSTQHIMGVVYLTRDGNQAVETIRQMQRDVLMLFFAALGVTFLLSLYLSGAIARPLRKLSIAAANVQQNFGRGVNIPDLSGRNDEIGDLSLSFKSMTDALSKRLDSIEKFAADVAHELKNPLTSLRSAVETVTIVKNDDDRKKLLNVIQHDVERLDRLITDISKASRLDAELSRDDTKIINLRALLVDMCHHHGVQLNLPQEENIAIVGAEGRMGQVFENLLSNAKSFSDNVSMLVELQGGDWVIYVDDEGIGIPDNKLEAIFDRFYTERPENEGFGNHSGLGLAICRQIMDAHGGRIYAENRYNHKGKKIGARFIVILKAVKK